MGDGLCVIHNWLIVYRQDSTSVPAGIAANQLLANLRHQMPAQLFHVWNASAKQHIVRDLFQEVWRTEEYAIAVQTTAGRLTRQTHAIALDVCVLCVTQGNLKYNSSLQYWIAFPDVLVQPPELDPGEQDYMV